MQKAGDAIGRLQSYIAGPRPIESQIAQLNSAEAALIAKWSTAGGDFPKLDADRRHELEEALDDARNRAAGAQRAIPISEAAIARVQRRGGDLARRRRRDRSKSCSSKSGRHSLQSRGKRTSRPRLHGPNTDASWLSRRRGDPEDRRPAVASLSYPALESSKRCAPCNANPAPSYDAVPWRDLASRLASDPSATVGGALAMNATPLEDTIATARAKVAELRKLARIVAAGQVHPRYDGGTRSPSLEVRGELRRGRADGADAPSQGLIPSASRPVGRLVQFARN